MRWRRIVVLGLAGLLVAAAALGVRSYGSFYGWWARPTVRDAPVAKAAAVEPVVSGLRLPFDLAFLPDGSALVTERETGRLRKVTTDGQLTEVRTIQEIAEPTKQAGLHIAATINDAVRARWQSQVHKRQQRVNGFRLLRDF
ncbi:PQQ-dependent sugar dehydrogenase [Streptomyces sp. NPDC060223]|uniref:PQQ-dependent sugar dehydrogenase n=1 Tax=unclassified Streptomyces TaxID=2593676 RepID=UPI003639E877